MKIYIANQSKQKIGGGWTFLANFTKYAKRQGIKIVDNVDDCDIYFIAGATMVMRDEVQQAKDKGKKIVLRVDNIPRNSRNRNTGTSRLYDFAQLSDLVIYQSKWAKDYISPFLKKDGTIILNGPDTEIFNETKGAAIPVDGKPQYLYIQFNRDETKQWHHTWYDFQMIQREDPDAHLWIIGNFSPEQQQYNFDFYNNERFRYVGVLDNPEDMAEYMRSADVLMLPYYNDACSNTLMEYLACNPWGFVMHNRTGGTGQIMKSHIKGIRFSADNTTKLYIEQFKRL